MREERSWLPAPGPELLIMGCGELLLYSLLKFLSQQLVLQGPTEAEGFSLGNLSQCWLHCCSLPKFALFFNSLFLWQHFWYWKSSDAHLLQLSRKRDYSEVNSLKNIVSLTWFISAFKNKWSPSLFKFVLLCQRKNADRRIWSLITSEKSLFVYLKTKLICLF